MPDKAWKAWEREGAKDLGGTRSGPLGSDVPDSLDTPIVAPEFKYMIRLLVREEDFQQAKRNAAKFGKLAVLAIKERGNTRKRAVMDWDDFVKLYWMARNSPEAHGITVAGR